MASPLATALMQATAAGTPQQPFRATVAPTDVEKAYNDYNNTMMQAYSAKLGQQNAMWGGLAGLGSAGITTLPKILSAAGPTAAAAAAPDISAGAMSVLEALGPAAVI